MCLVNFTTLVLVSWPQFKKFSEHVSLNMFLIMVKVQSVCFVKALVVCVFCTCVGWGKFIILKNDDSWNDIDLFFPFVFSTHFKLHRHSCTAADLHSKVLDARPPPQLGPIFFIFHAVFGKFWPQNNRLSPQPTLGFVPMSGESRIRPCRCRRCTFYVHVQDLKVCSHLSYAFAVQKHVEFPVYLIVLWLLCAWRKGWGCRGWCWKFENIGQRKLRPFHI